MSSLSGPNSHHRSSPATEPQHALSEIDRQLFHCLSLGLVVFDPQLTIVRHNPAADFLVAGHASIVDALAADTVDSRYRDWRAALREVIENRREQRYDQVVHRDAEHGERLLDLLCIPLTDPDGTQVTGGTLVIEDITAQASMEQRLAVSERMAAVGKLAARVAHELNNPLDGILRYLNLAIRAVETQTVERLSDYLLQARGGLVRMTEIIRELVEFSRSSHTAFDDTGINSVVEEAARVMADLARQHGITTVCRLQDDMPAMRGTNLFQVFCNLIKNAIDAMSDGGTLTIVTQTVGTEAVIRFEDTGVGLPEEMDRIFEPFFTTKPPGKGTGLGLAICKDIIEKYNGRITPGRRPDGGTVFTIRIPLASCATIRRPMPARPATDSAFPDTHQAPKEPSA